MNYFINFSSYCSYYSKKMNKFADQYTYFIQ